MGFLRHLNSVALGLQKVLMLLIGDDGVHGRQSELLQSAVDHLVGIFEWRIQCPLKLTKTFPARLY